ncbi:3-oxoacyl-ACP reductase, partial [Pseudomonas syringae]
METRGAYSGVGRLAGLTRVGAFPALSDADRYQLLRSNLDRLANVVHPLTLPMIRRRAAGRIVCITPVSVLIGSSGQLNSSASYARHICSPQSLAHNLEIRRATGSVVAPRPEGTA